MRITLALAAAIAGMLLLVPVLLLLAPLWLVSACTRRLAQLLEPRYLTRDELIAFDRTFGWRPRPHLNTHHLMGDLFKIVTDGDGWRGRATLAESDIVAIGDSFAAGYGVGENDIFANLAKRLRVKPIGIGGYSMVQELLWMRELAPALRGKLVVWFIYFGNDLYDNLSPELRGYRKPFLRERRDDDGWDIVSNHVTAEPWPIAARARKGHVHMATLAQLCAETHLATRAYRACEWLVEQARQQCESAGAELVVLTIPDPHQLSVEGHAFLTALEPGLRNFDSRRPDRMLESICARVGVPLIAGSSFLDLRCYKENDCHWNEAGHRRVAAALEALRPGSTPGVQPAPTVVEVA